MSSTGLIYVVYNEWIRNPETGEMPYKIGITKNSVSERYYGLGLKMPGEFETLFAYKLDRYEQAEQALQNILAKRCVNGEWFSITQKEIDLIKSICEAMGGTLVTDEVKQAIETQAEETDEDDIPAAAHKPIGGKNFDKYLFNGQTYGKGRLVLSVVEEYCRQHPTATLSELQQVFPKNLQGGFFVADTLRSAQNIKQASPLHKSRHFLDDPITLANGEETAVTNQWGRGNIGRFLAKARNLGFKIEVCK